MTDSMKFGPEWLRNMSTDSTNPGLSSGNGGNTSGSGGATINNSSMASNIINSSGGGTGGGGHQYASGAPYTPAPRNMFPEFRYGREEMLSLFDKNCSMPELLPWYKKIFVDKVQFPLALTPSTEDEMLIQGPVVPTQRPAWIQRSPVGFSSSTRGTGRGGSVDRGRMRGKSVYHPIFQRPTALFEDDLRPTMLKSERSWSERNGAGDSLGIGVSSGTGPGGVGSLGADWNGTPVASPRKEFSSHPRNMENWRRNRNEDGSGDASTGGGGGGGLASTDGWRGGSTNATSFGSTHRWGRSTSWRDEENSAANAESVPYGGGGGPTTMQRSYSTISTTVTERGGNFVGNSISKGSSQNSTNYSSGGNSSRVLNSTGGQSIRTNQWSTNSSSGGGVDNEDNLPEWAMENPSDSGGTFDASGAFHGSVEERDFNAADGTEDSVNDHQSLQRKKSRSSSNESSTRGGEDNSNSKITEKNTSTPEKETSGAGINFDDSISSEHNIFESAKQKISSADLQTYNQREKQQEPPIAYNTSNNNKTASSSVLNLVENTASISSSSSMSSSSSAAALSSVANLNYFKNAKAQMQITNTSSSVASSHNDFSDRMKAVADDMVEKLIMDSDDDTNKCTTDSTPKTTATTSSAVSSSSTVNNMAAHQQQQNAFVTPALAAILKQSTVVHQTDVVTPSLSSIVATSGSHSKGAIPLYGGGVVVDHATMQQHHLQQQQLAAAAAATVAAGGVTPHHTTLNNSASDTDLWYYRDPQAKVQGPFTAIEMTEWYRAGYFNENLFVRRVCDTRFRALGELIKVCLNNMPFTHSHLIPSGAGGGSNGLENMHLTNSVSVVIPTNTTQLSRGGDKVVLNDYALKQQQQQQNEQREELKSNATATAESLSAAVKNNISSVDMSHMLNLHFQMLQEQYLRQQEMKIVTELSTNECFQRLTPPEREAVVRQKVQIHGLPEYLTSLSGLSNTLATVNPAAGNQLYDVIAECSKNEQQHHLMHQQQSTAVAGGGNMKTFLDADDFILNVAQQQQQQQTSSTHTFPSSPYAALLRSGSDISNSGGNEFNMRMFLSGGGGNAGQQQQQKSPQDFLAAAANANDFITEQRLLAAAAAANVQSPMIQMWMPQLAGATALAASAASSSPPHPQIMNQQLLQQQQSQNNQWAGGPLVGIPSAVIASGVGQPKAMPTSMWDVTSLDQVQHQQQQQQQQQQTQQLEQQYNINFDSQKAQNLLQNMQSKDQPQQQESQMPPQQCNVAVAVENLAEIQTQHQHQPSPDINQQQQLDSAALVVLQHQQQQQQQQQQHTPTAAALTNNNNNKQRKDEATDKLNLNKRNGNNIKLQQHQQSFTTKLKDDTTTNNTHTLNRKNEEERRREIAEEKRRQKEERKRQQVEEEKRRQQQHEEEKRRQMLEEKERQTQIQAQRRKALLGSGCNTATTSFSSAITPAGVITSTASSGVGGNKSNRSSGVQSSIAPWSTQNTAAATGASKPGPPCLADIQKAERRERRADQQRQMELLERQIRANAAAAEANDLMLKWNSSPVPPVAVKSFAEIQAEEAKRLAVEQLEMQRRKEHEQQQSALAAAAAAAGGIAPFAGGSGVVGVNVSSGCNNNIAAIWGGTKVWGGGAINSSNSSGFWEEQISNKFSTAVTPANTTTAAIVAAGLTNSVKSTSHQQTATGQLQQQASGSAARNLRKSQTVSIMQNTAAVPAAKNNAKSNNFVQQQQQTLNQALKQQQSNKLQKSEIDKKLACGKNQNNNGSGAACLATTSNKRDDFENEFTGWCTKSLNSMNTKVDVPTFVTFLQDLESPYEVKDYIRMYLGESKEYTEFSKQFLERRSKYKNLQRAQNAHNDDMCKPAPAITPSGNDNSDNKGKQKKVNKKNKMTKLDARILGFSVTAAEGRINVGDRDYVDAP